MAHRYRGLFNRDEEEEIKYLSKPNVVPVERREQSSGIQFYTRDKNGQYQLWPTKSRRKEVVIVSVLVALIILGTALFFLIS